MKMFVVNAIYIFLNYVVNYIPCWTIRKVLYRCMGMKIGKGTRINMRCVIMSPWKIRIGENTMINEYTLLDGRGGLTIGSNCSFSMWSVVYTASHYANSPDFEYYTKETSIGDFCWLGTRCVIMPGSKLGNGSIISVNSVFKGEAVENGIYSGSPATFLRNRALEGQYKLNTRYYFV